MVYVFLRVCQSINESCTKCFTDLIEILHKAIAIARIKLGFILFRLQHRLKMAVVFNVNTNLRIFNAYTN